MDGSIKVAVVQGDRRRGAVAQALGLIADDVRDRVSAVGAAVVAPTLDDLGRAWASTDRDTLSATIDALLAGGASSIDVAAGRGGRTAFDRLGYSGETWGRPVSYHDPNAEPDAEAWESIEAPGGPLRVASRFFASGCRVSLAIARTHGVFRLGLGLPSLSTVVHPDDRPRLEPSSAPFPSAASTRAAAASSLLESLRGWLVRGWLGLRSLDGGMMLTGPERRRLERIERATDSLSVLAASVLPRISVVDGFVGMHGEGPRLGRPLRLGTVVAGTDPVAVDAVAAAIMGFDPLDVAYLRRAQAAGLGVADLAAITIVGEPWSQVRRKCRRHASDRLLRLVSGPAPDPGAGLSVPRPHFRSRRARAARKSWGS